MTLTTEAETDYREQIALAYQAAKTCVDQSVEDRQNATTAAELQTAIAHHEQAEALATDFAQRLRAFNRFVATR